MSGKKVDLNEINDTLNRILETLKPKENKPDDYDYINYVCSTCGPPLADCRASVISSEGWPTGCLFKNLAEPNWRREE